MGKRTIEKECESTYEDKSFDDVLIDCIEDFEEEKEPEEDDFERVYDETNFEEEIPTTTKWNRRKKIRKEHLEALNKNQLDEDELEKLMVENHD